MDYILLAGISRPVYYFDTAIAMSHSHDIKLPAYYDTYLGGIMFEPFAADLANRVHYTTGMKMLELACGTGRLTRHLVKYLDGNLLATDISQQMIDHAKQLLPTGVSWLQLDAHDLSFEAATFNAVVCQFGVMLFADKEKVVANVHHVLAPGGQLLFNVWDNIEYNPRPKMLIKAVKQVLGNASPDFYTNGPFCFYDHAVISRLLTAAGFHNISLELVERVGIYPSIDHMIKGFVNGSPVGTFIVQQPASVQVEIITRFSNMVLEQYGAVDIISPMRAIACTATKAS